MSNSLVEYLEGSLRLVYAMKDIAFSRTSTPISIENSTLPDPVIQYDEQEEIWILTKSYTYQGDGYQIIVPANFKFDLASVPRIFWWAISPFDLSISAPLIHDFIFRHRGKPPQGTVIPERTFVRREVDQLFNLIMKQEGVVTWRRVIAYYAVRLVSILVNSNWET